MDWGWNPDTVVSVSTSVAAAATAILAFFTWKLATRTTELARQTSKDVDAQWVPVVVMQSGRTVDESGIVGFPLENVGHGVAMGIHLEIQGQRVMAGPFLLAAQATRDAEMQRVPPEILQGPLRLLIHYHDVPKARSYLTTIDLARAVPAERTPLRPIDTTHASADMPPTWPPTAAHKT